MCRGLNKKPQWWQEENQNMKGHVKKFQLCPKDNGVLREIFCLE